MSESQRKRISDIESALSRISENALNALEEVGAKHDYSPVFRDAVKAWMGIDFLDIYDEWVEEGASGGVPQ